MAGATPIYGLRYDTLDDPPNAATLGQELATDVETELDRIDSAIADSGWITAGIIAETGWSLSGTNQVRKIGSVCYAVLEATRTGSTLTAGSTGDIPDTLMITMPVGFRPVVNAYTTYRSTTSGAVQINTTGGVFIIDAHAGASIATGTAVKVTTSFPIN